VGGVNDRDQDGAERLSIACVVGRWAHAAGNQVLIDEAARVAPDADGHRAGSRRHSSLALDR